MQIRVPEIRVIHTGIFGQGMIADLKSIFLILYLTMQSILRTGA